MTARLSLFAQLLFLTFLLSLGAPLVTAQSPALENDRAAIRVDKVQTARIAALEAKVSRLEHSRIAALETKVGGMDRKIERAGSTGLVLVVCGAFCALWAQNTGRNAFAWFVFGALFNVIALMVLLSKNSSDKSQTPRSR